MSKPTQKRKKYIKQEKHEGNEFSKVMVFMPKDMYEIINAEAKRTGLKRSRLVAIAIDNELDTEKPFTYNCNMPDTVTEYGIGADAQTILDFLSPFTRGVSLDTLVLCRRTLDLSRERVLAAVRYLESKDWVDVFQKSKYFDEVFPNVRIRKDARKELEEKGLIGRRK